MSVDEWRTFSSEDALKTASENGAVQLTQSDWAEILAILGQTLEAIKTGDFGEGEDHSAWVSQLERITEKIGGSMDGER